MEFSFSQLLNAYLPILVTLFFIVTVVRFSQPENIKSLILVRPFPKLTLFRFSQIENTEEPMLVTLSGMVMFVSEPQLLNAK